MGENDRRLIAEQITACRRAGLEAEADRLTELLASECDLTTHECKLSETAPNPVAGHVKVSKEQIEQAMLPAPVLRAEGPHRPD